MIWVYFFMAIFFCFIGITIHVFKWYFLLAGYNTMPKEKQEKVDTENLGKFFGKYAYFNGSVFLLSGIFTIFGIKVGLIFPLTITGISTIYFLIRAQKYDGNIYDEKGKLRKGAWKEFIIPLIIIGIALGFVIFLIFISSQPTKITFTDEGFKIHGLYGEKIPWESIEDVKLIENSPSITMRTNGSALGSNLKGHFSTVEYGAVKLFINTSTPPFIYLQRSGKDIILNFNKPDETNRVYQEMLKYLSQK